MKVLKKSALGSLAFGLMLAFVAVFTPLAPVASAADCEDGSGGLGAGIECANPGEDVPQTLFGEGSIFNLILTTILFIVGIISVVMLIIGGIRYATSAGDQAAVTGAKNTILYAIIGLVVSLVAFAAVTWIFGSLTT